MTLQNGNRAGFANTEFYLLVPNGLSVTVLSAGTHQLQDVLIPSSHPAVSVSTKLSVESES